MGAVGRTAAGLGALVAWQLVWLVVAVDGQGLRRMNTTVARDHVGEDAVVCGQVVNASCSTQRGGAIVLATNDPLSSFTLRIPLEHRGKFGPHPEEQHLQKFVCAAGRIERQDSRYAIVLTDPSAMSVLPDRPGLPMFAPDVVRPCDPGVALPRAVRDVKPQYTAGAMRDKAQGAVVVQAIVKSDGTVGDLRVVRSLHPELDEAAADAARRWRFEAGTLNGQPVPVLVVMELTFTLRN